MAKFAKGDVVAQVLKPITGTVTGFQVDQETGELLVKVEWTMEDGSTNERFFKDDEIEVVQVEA